MLSSEFRGYFSILGKRLHQDSDSVDGEHWMTLRTIQEVDRLFGRTRGEMRSLERLSDLWVEYRVNGGASQAGNAERERECRGEERE